MKKHYEVPELELIKFMSEDVLNESDPTGNGNEGTPSEDEEM